MMKALTFPILVFAAFLAVTESTRIKYSTGIQSSKWASSMNLKPADETKIYTKFRNRGYPARVIQKAIDSVLHDSRQVQKLPSERSEVKFYKSHTAYQQLSQALDKVLPGTETTAGHFVTELRSKGSREYFAVKRNFRFLLLSIHVHILAAELYAQDVIDESMLLLATNSDTSSYYRAVKLMLAILSLIKESGPGYYYKFVKILKEVGYTEITEKFSATLAAHEDKVRPEISEKFSATLAAHKDKVPPGVVGLPTQISPQLTEENLGVILKEIVAAADKYFDLGLELNIPINILTDIENTPQDSITRLRRTILEWLHRGRNRTWRVLAQALGSELVGRNALMNRILQKYCQ